MAVIAIDFDGTLFGETVDGEPVLIAGAKQAMVDLHQAGHHLVVHTCRTAIARDQGRLAGELAWIAETLITHGIPFHEIYAGDKMIADVYVDDRAVAFQGDWSETVASVDRRLRRLSRAG